MIERIKSWFTEDRAATDYTGQMIAASFAAARGLDGVKGSAAFQSCVNLIASAVSIAEVSGQHSEALQPHLGQIARSLVVHGESLWIIDVDGGGRLMLLPVTVHNVIGSASPATWRYSMQQAGPSQTIGLERPAGAVLHFRANVQADKAPWRGRPALEAANTSGALLAALEVQFGGESRMKPARLLSIGRSDTQRLSGSRGACEGRSIDDNGRFGWR